MSGGDHNQADQARTLVGLCPTCGIGEEGDCQVCAPLDPEASREDNGGDWCKECERYFFRVHSHAARGVVSS